MHLETTYRNLNEAEAAAATQLLQRGAKRLAKIVTATTTLRAVIDGTTAEHRVTLVALMNGTEFTSHADEYDLPLSISTALERLRVQIVRHRERKEAMRHRSSLAA